MCAEFDTLEVLCLNAGRGGAAGDPRDETDGMESIMLTNVYGHFTLLSALMPLLKAADAARVVTQSSGARFRAKPEKVHDLDGTNKEVFNNFDQCVPHRVATLYAPYLRRLLLTTGTVSVRQHVS